MPFRLLFIIKARNFKMNRFDARENAFAVVFCSHFQKDAAPDEVISSYLESQNIENDEYFDKLFHTVWENLEEIDGLIERNLNNWKINRISKVALAALRLGVAEIKYIDETPNHVAINESIEIAKKYEDQKCGNFVNGVLSAIMKEQ